MKPALCAKSMTKLQDNLYSGLNNFSQSNKVLGRFLSIPVSLVDVAIDALKTPIVIWDEQELAKLEIIHIVAIQ